MKTKVNSKLIVSVVLAVVLVIVVTAGISYAFFYYFRQGTKNLTFETGSIRLELGEIGEGISLVDQFPINDEEGMALNETYTFTITGYNTGTIPIYYDISAVLGNEIEGKTRFNDDEIKIYITDELGTPVFGAESPTGLKEMGESILVTDIIPGRTPKATPIIKTYVLRLWITNDRVWISETDHPEGKNTYTPTEFKNRYFSMKIKVTGNMTPRITGRNLVTAINEDLAKNLYTPAGDTDQTFIVGTASDTNYKPNNYLWYSGKLWRIVSLNKTNGEVTSVKVITQDPIAVMSRDGTAANGGTGGTGFLNSYMYQFLNEDFYDSLRNPENFIVTNYQWNATYTSNTNKPAKTTMVTAPVGTINVYEYYVSYTNTTISNGYLNLGFYTWLLNPYKTSGEAACINQTGEIDDTTPPSKYSVRPAVNLNPNLIVVAGDGTLTNPYRLAGDNDTPNSGTLLNTRYSGEYVLFDNEKYRIVTIENNLTKLVKEDYIRDSSGTRYVKKFSTSSSLYSDSLGASNTDYVGKYLNDESTGWYSTLSTSSQNMIQEATWYLGTISSGQSYKKGICETVKTIANGGTLTKECTKTSVTATAKIGLLRFGEFFGGQLGTGSISKVYHWSITPVSTGSLHRFGSAGDVYDATASSNTLAMKPSFYLKSDVKITGGNGTSSNPFILTM